MCSPKINIIGVFACLSLMVGCAEPSPTVEVFPSADTSVDLSTSQYSNEDFSFYLPPEVVIHPLISEPDRVVFTFAHTDSVTGFDSILPLTMEYPVAFVGKEFDTNLDERIDFYAAQNLAPEDFLKFNADGHDGYVEYHRLDLSGEEKICGVSLEGAVEGKDPNEILTFFSDSECPYEASLLVQEVINTFISTLKFK